MSDAWSGSDYDDEENQTIVMDNGSFTHRAGFGGDDAPRAVFPSVVGQASQPTGANTSSMLPGLDQTVYVGDSAVSKSSRLSITYPVEEGRIVDMDAMEKLWRHTFTNELRVVPEECNVLMTVKPRCHVHDKEGITEVYLYC